MRQRNAPWPSKDLSGPLSGVYLKYFGHAFQNASLECDTLDALFLCSSNENGKIEVAIK